MKGEWSAPWTVRPRVVVLAALAILLLACSSAPAYPPASSLALSPQATNASAPSPAQAIIPTPEPEPLPPLLTQAKPVAGTNIIRQAYSELREKLFREVQPSELLTPAWKAVLSETERLSGDAIDIGPYAATGSNDIDAFIREFSSYATGPADGLDSTLLSQAAVRGMTDAVGDSHTRFLTPEQAENQRRAAEGLPPANTYTGIGIRIDLLNESVTIAEVYTGTPAELAGLRAGDRILRVNGQAIESLPIGDISAQVRGPIGTEVRLTVARGAEETLEVAINRATIVQPTDAVVSARMVEGDIGYVRVRSFPRKSALIDAAAEFDRELARLLAQGARGIILDLRGNPGGDPITSVAIASNFVTQGSIFTSINREGRRTPYLAMPRTTVFKGPLAVLIDRGSASGAEVVASSLQENGAGFLIGTKSCGCLSVGRPIQLGDTSGIVVTVEQAVTGLKERSLEGVGLDPDELVRPALTGAEDTQQARAIAYLRRQLP